MKDENKRDKRSSKLVPNFLHMQGGMTQATYEKKKSVKNDTVLSNKIKTRLVTL